jgi:hypothetical protein
MDRVGRDIGIAVLEININHNEVVNMIKVVPDLLLRHLAGNASYDKISRRSTGDLVGDMSRYMKVPISPTELELKKISRPHLRLLHPTRTRLVCR